MDYLPLIDRSRTLYKRSDVTPIFAQPAAFERLVEDLVRPFEGERVQLVAGLDALGFILGTAMALKLDAGFLPIRKGGKLPVRHDRESAVDYQGKEKILELRLNPFPAGTRVLLADDWIETGAQARAAKRDADAIQNSLGIIIRNAAACFSKDSRAILARQGLNVENPFVGIRRSQKIDPVAALDREVVDRIWKELPLLRDGDPNAEVPNIARFTKHYRKIHEGRKARWMPIDFRQPHAHAYCAILLGLGLGLRANEIDKARWSWFKFDANGTCFLEIREEPDFKPKGGTMRVIRIPGELHDELVKARLDLASPYVLGGQASKSVEKNGWGYRCRETLRVVNTWLREHGVETNDLRGNPLHRLRKQFGSEVATGFGLFAAQKLLGHSSPTVTAKYYAAQTELPKLTHVRIMG